MLVDLWYALRYSDICATRVNHEANMWTTGDIYFTPDTIHWDCPDQHVRHISCVFVIVLVAA